MTPAGVFKVGVYALHDRLTVRREEFETQQLIHRYQTVPVGVEHHEGVPRGVLRGAALALDHGGFELLVISTQLIVLRLELTRVQGRPLAHTTMKRLDLSVSAFATYKRSTFFPPQSSLSSRA